MSLKTVFFLLFSQTVFAQFSTENLRFSIEAHLLANGEINATHNVLGGIGANYLFDKKSIFQPYSKISIQSNIGNNYARIWLLDFSGGSSIKLTKRLFIAGSAGLLFQSEKISPDLIDRPAIWKNSGFGFSANLGFGYQFSKKIDAFLSAKQFHTIGTSVNLSTSFSF